MLVYDRDFKLNYKKDNTSLSHNKLLVFAKFLMLLFQDIFFITTTRRERISFLFLFLFSYKDYLRYLHQNLLYQLKLCMPQIKLEPFFYIVLLLLKPLHCIAPSLRVCARFLTQPTIFKNNSILNRAQQNAIF